MSVERAEPLEARSDGRVAGSARTDEPVQCGACWAPSGRMFDARTVLAVQRTAGNHAAGAFISAQRARGRAPLRRSPLRLARLLPARYQITGRLNAPSAIKRIFFDRGDATLHPVEAAKLAQVIAANPAGTPLELKGLRSEDEDPGVATSRVNAVEAALAAEVPPAGPRTLNPQPDAGVGRIDYRSARVVEIIPAGTVSTEPDCSAGPSAFPTPPAQEAAFVAARTQATGWLDAANAALAPPRAATTDILLRLFFRSDTNVHAAQVRGNLIKIKAQIARLTPAARHQSANLCDGHCASGAIAYLNGNGATAVMTICPGFENRDPNDNARNLIHEAAHGTPGMVGASQGTIDTAYRHERMLNFISRADALRNSDSYSIFAMRHQRGHAGVHTGCGREHRRPHRGAVPEGAPRARAGGEVAHMGRSGRGRRL
jgi:Lysine-specific metallo-endopeptidase